LGASGRGEAVTDDDVILFELSWASMIAAVRILSEYSSRERTGVAAAEGEASTTGVDGPAVPGVEEGLVDDRECCRLCNPPNDEENPGTGEDVVLDQVARSKSLFLGVGGTIIEETSSSSLVMSG
jgi:hypothetical protein